MATAIAMTGCSDESPWIESRNGDTGTISLTLTTTGDIRTTKPIFKNEEGTRATSNDLGDYINMPTPEDFSIRLEKADGSFTKTWNTLTAFRNETDREFKTGAYTLTAFYGEKGKQDFNAPYFEASTSFTVLSDQTSEVELTAELKNSLVKVNYTDDFKNYMSAYSSSLRTDGRTDEILFSESESRAAFVEPKNANLTVHFTTAAKGQETSLSLGDFAPEAKTLHNITLDIAANEYGTGTLKVNFDTALTTEAIEIDLSENVLNTPAPIIICDGFENGESIEMLERNAIQTPIKMNVRAKGIIASAELTVTKEGDNYLPAWCTDASGQTNPSSTFDLCTATPAQQALLESAGISAKGIYPEANPGEMGLIDLTQYGNSLSEGNYTISLVVKDKNGASSEMTTVKLNSQPIHIDMAGTPSILYGSGKAVLTLDYNGFNPNTDITFSAVNAFGTHETAEVLSCEESTGTRSFEDKRYIYTITLPQTTKSEIEIKVFHKSRLLKTYSVGVVEPTYTITGIDAYAHYAYVKLSTPDDTDNPAVLAAVVNNIKLKVGGAAVAVTDRDPAKGIVCITGLTNANTQYTIDGSCIISAPTEKWNTESTRFTTEQEQTLPNGDFSQTDGTVNSNGKLKIGGEYGIWLLFSKTYTNYVSFSYDLPSNWGTVNSVTASADATTRNTWYVVPSSWVDNGEAIMRNVGYSHNGKDMDKTDDGNTTTTNYYNRNSPSESQLDKAAGEIFLGEYSADRSKDGIGFTTRPNSVSFDYRYTPIENDKGYVTVEVLDASGVSIGSGEKQLEGKETNTAASVDIKYNPFGGTAAKIKVRFKSSYRDNPPINIPTGTALDDEISEGTFSANILTNSGVILSENSTYHALATGSVLTIDNVKVNYANTPASNGAAAAPKRVNKTAKNRR